MSPRRNKTPNNIFQMIEGMRSDYNAAKSSRYRRARTGVTSLGSSADYHYSSESDYLKIMEYARDMDRNDPIVGQIVDRAVVNTIQDGIKVDPDTGDPSLDEDLSARWREWSEDADQCDVSGEMTFSDMELLALRSCFVDGDILGLPLVEGSMQLIEAHRLRTPSKTKRNVVHGVLMDDRRRRLEYWITKQDIEPHRAIAKVADIFPIAARDGNGNRQVYHIYNPKRVTQTRGVSAFAPIFDEIGMHGDIQFAKLVQQQIVSCFAIFHERETDTSMFGTPDYGAGETDTLSSGDTRTIEGIAPGMEIFGSPGEKLSGFSPNVPNQEYFQHSKLILQVIGVNLGLPLALVLLDASETNFSGWRGAVDQARLGFRRNQKWLINKLHRPVYQWKVRQWIADDPALAAAERNEAINVYGHKWNPPSWPYIEPLKDAQADLLRVRNTLISPRRLHAERGRDWQDVYREIIEDNKEAIVAAKNAANEINGSITDKNPVHWRELLSLPTPDGVKIDIASAGNNQPLQEDSSNE